jgi:glycerophosphoryl diester phosphodiesterase
LVAPGIPRGLLAGRLPADWQGALGALSCATLHLDHRRAGAAMVRALAAAGVPVLLYTVNDPARARDLLAAGAAAVITDVPDLLLAEEAQ